MLMLTSVNRYFHISCNFSNTLQYTKEAVAAIDELTLSPEIETKLPEALHFYYFGTN